MMLTRSEIRVVRRHGVTVEKEGTGGILVGSMGSEGVNLINAI